MESVLYTVRSVVGSYERFSFGNRLVLVPDALSMVGVAFPDAVPSETRIYTVTYKRGPASNPEGSLVDGGTVQLKNRMVFNVTFTDKS